jgi:DNA-binding response OmpR family regulator
MPHHAKAVLWVDDEAELLEPHRIFLRDKGFDVHTATNADDAARARAASSVRPRPAR